MLIDSHCHCYMDSMHETKPLWLKNIEEKKVQHILLPNIDKDSISFLEALVDENPRLFVPMMGIHPCDIKESYKSDLEWIQNHYQKNPNRYFGIGEIGLDYHWDLTFQKEQIWAFEAQLEWAIAENKAVSIHSRKANQDTIPIVTKHAKKGLKGVMHCFSGSIQEAEEIMDAGFFLGIGGVVTYPKAGLAEILPQIPLSKIVLETDAPFLPPVPHRSKQNESGYLFHVAEKLAEIYNIPYDEVAQITSQNAIQLFNLQSLMA